MKIKTLINLTVLLLIVSCGNSIEFKESPIPQFSGTFPITALSFNYVSEEILKPKCIQCHKGYENYETVKVEKDKILDAVIKGRMPKNAPALSNGLKALLGAWVSAGAPFGEGVDPPPSTGLAANWQSISEKIIFPKCFQCHNPNGQASFLDLSSRQRFFEARSELLNNFEDVRNSYLIEVISDPEEPMPPEWSDIERLSENEIKVLIEWIELGLP